MTVARIVATRTAADVMVAEVATKISTSFRGEEPNGFVIIYVLGVPSRPHNATRAALSLPLALAAEPATLSLCDTFCARPREEYSSIDGTIGEEPICVEDTQ